MKNKINKSILNLSLMISFFALLGTLLFSISVFAAPKTKVIIFYADWSAKSRMARPEISSVVNSRPDIQYFELNVDLASTPEQARSFDVPIPKTVPFIYIKDKNDRIVYKNIYSKNTASQILNYLK